MHAVAGLSVARIESVRGDTVVFSGADVVDGTPVLDIKPYIPFVDGVVDASAPHWVSHSLTACATSCSTNSASVSAATLCINLRLISNGSHYRVRQFKAISTLAQRCAISAALDFQVSLPQCT